MKRIFQKFHNELLRAIEGSKSRTELDDNIAEIAREYLPGGVAELPEGIRARLALRGIYS